jgi:hypothetical protein
VFSYHVSGPNNPYLLSNIAIFLLQNDPHLAYSHADLAVPNPIFIVNYCQVWSILSAQTTHLLLSSMVHIISTNDPPFIVKYGPYYQHKRPTFYCQVWSILSAQTTHIRMVYLLSELALFLDQNDPLS